MRRSLLAFVAISLGVGLAASCAGSTSIRGVVVTEAGAPVPGATVRVQATGVLATTDGDGAFELEVTEAVRLSASAPGYYIAGGEEHSPGSTVDFVLHAIPATDNPDYEWLTVDAAGVGEDQGCAACHSSAGTDLAFDLPVDEWRSDAHSKSARNPRFLTMYLGMDVEGRFSPPTRYVTNRDYGLVPLPPDPSMPYYGPGYKLDFPDTAGNCGACHVPVAAANDPYGVDVGDIAGVAIDWITCDFCH